MAGVPSSTRIADDRAPVEATGWLSTLALVGLVTLLRLVYVLWLSPYALIEDEAYYWLWSRHLDWSYATKGPGIALTIATGVHLLGDTEAGVRATSPLWGALLAWCIAGAAGQLAPAQARSRARFWGAVAALLTTPLQAVSILMLIDGPLLACWAAATWAALRALHARGTWAWIALGLAVAAGVLFKPIILLLLPCLIAHALTARASLDLAPRWPAWLAAGLALAMSGCIPILTWNAAHDWMTVTHLLGHISGDAAGPALSRRAAWVAEYLALQLLLGGAGLIAGLLGAKYVRTSRHALASPPAARSSSPTSGLRLCLWTSLPIYTLYLIIACFTRVEGNWPLAGLIGWLAPAGAWLAQARASTPAPRVQRHARRALVIIGLITGLGMLRLDLAARLPLIGPAIPVGRLLVGPALADAAAECLASRPDFQGLDAPLVLTDHYGSASQLAFYLPRQSPFASATRITCATGVLGRPPTQFDLWPDTRADDERIRGRSAVLIGSRPDVWETIFRTVQDAGPIPGDHKRRRVFIGIGYRGGTRGTEAAGG